MQKADSANEAQVSPGASFSRALAFVLLLSVAAIFECVRLSALWDPEIWGHLRIGTWILEHRSLPEAGLFSQASGLPWMDFSWGFDAVVALVYRVAGLRALALLMVAFRIALAGVIFLLAGGRRNFWGAAALSAIAQYVLFRSLPFAAIVSLLFFGAALLLLLQVREKENLRLLYVLPALFLLWANLDPGFVYGILLYVLFFGALLFEKWAELQSLRWFERPPRQISLASVALAGAACLLASCLTPNTIHPFAAFFADEFSPVNKNLPGFNSMGFRQPQDYALMLLAMAAFLALGLRRSRDLFRIGLLCAATALAFYSQRENWLLALASVAVIGHAVMQTDGIHSSEPAFRWNWQQAASAGAACVLVFAVFLVRVPRNQDALLAKAGEKLPVRAADFLHQHPQPTPLFNCYQWGSFLTWYLPEYPVAIDARRGLYPDDQELDYFKVMNAEIPYQQFASMKNARTVLLDKASVMGEALRGVSGFQVLYEDDVSVVYSHEVKE